jgi:hypothetical protein
MTGLAMLAIVGMLLMHGLGPAALGLADTGHHAAEPDPAGGVAVHGVLGLCVFVIAVAGLIASTTTDHRRHGRRRTLVPNRPAGGIAVTVPVGGRLRLLELCVMRV